LHKNGITEDNLQKLLHHAMIPDDKKQIILNLQNMGMTILQKTNSTPTSRRVTLLLQDTIKPAARLKNIPQNRKERENSSYQLSRWTPYVKDLMENIVDEKLDMHQFPFIYNRCLGSRNLCHSRARLVQK